MTVMIRDLTSDDLDLVVVSGDLADATSDAFIDRRNVALAPVSSIGEGTINLTLTVSGIALPGTFSGPFEIRLMSGDTIVASDTALARVLVRPRADVTAIVPEEGFQRAKCTIACRLARWLVHGDVHLDSIDVHLSHTALDTLQVGNAVLVLVGARSGSAVRVGPQQLSGFVPPEGATVALPSGRTTLEPDSYSGKLAITVPDLPRPVETPFRVDVRSGPGLALIVLLLGIACSRWFVEINQAPNRSGLGHQAMERKEGLWFKLAGFAWYPTAPDWGTRTFAFLTGVPWTADNRFEGHLRRLAVFLLYAAAAVEGMNRLYTSNSTFGAAPLADYAAMFFWPFTAEVVTRGLGNLKWPRTLRVFLEPGSASAQVGKKVAFDVKLTGGSGGSPRWTCTSSDQAVATVEETPTGCTAECKAAGSATITVRVVRGVATVTDTAELAVG
jgi:hypothetical protein